MTVRPAAKVRNRQTTWYVQSETQPGTYYIVHYKRDITTHHPKWTCNCPDFTERRQFNGTNCKHIAEASNYKASMEAGMTASFGNGFPMPTVRQIIDALVRVLNEGPVTDAELLWNLITILRGPDSSDDKLKEDTVAAIRGVLGLTYRNIVVTHRSPVGIESVDPNRPLDTRLNVRIKVEEKYPKAQSHFVTHYTNALIALKRLGYIK